MSTKSKREGYGQFCPVAMASEIVCARWTPLILRELLCGTTRFNDLRRGVPRMSPTLLSKRLKELVKAGVVTVSRPDDQSAADYKLTEAGQQLRDIVMSLGVWGQQWVESSLSLKNLDPSLLMWDMRRRLSPTGLPDRRCTLNFIYPELKTGQRSWWLVIEGGKVDLCSVDPGYDIDIFVQSSLRSMTAVWMGLSTLKREMDAGNIELTGDRTMIRSMNTWLGFSVFASPAKQG